LVICEHKSSGDKSQNQRKQGVGFAFFANRIDAQLFLGFFTNKLGGLGYFPKNRGHFFLSFEPTQA